MVRKIRKKKRVVRRAAPAGATGGQSTWTVPFDGEGHAGVWVHKHGDSDDHSNCGPLVVCCQNAIGPYSALCPDLVTGVESWQPQNGPHLAGWFDGGLGAMYFAVCDPDDPNAVFLFGLAADDARALVNGQVPLAYYRRTANRHVLEEL